MKNAKPPQPLTPDEAAEQMRQFDEVFGVMEEGWRPMPEVAPGESTRGFYQVVTDAVTISVHADVAQEYRIQKG